MPNTPDEVVECCCDTCMLLHQYHYCINFINCHVSILYRTGIGHEQLSGWDTSNARCPAGYSDGANALPTREASPSPWRKHPLTGWALAVPTGSYEHLLAVSGHEGSDHSISGDILQV